MKNKISITIIAFLVVFTLNAQEKKIKFSKGTLKICSSKTFKIEGYNGSEVIIKRLYENKAKFYGVNDVRFSSKNNKNKEVVVTAKGINSFNKKSDRNKEVVVTAKGINSFNKKSDRNKEVVVTAKGLHSSGNYLYFSANNSKRKKGLKRLGKKQENKELGIYFTIEQKNGELIFKDATNGQFVMLSNESYLIKIPNSIKLNWDTSNCQKENKRQHFFYSNKTSSLSNFNGEVELTTSLNNFKLTDVTGPVSINSIGGNVTVVFDKKAPLKLYSVYTNNGFIDITMPANSDVNVEANGAAIYSNLDFTILQDRESEGQQQMKLKLKRGKVKMKLEAGLGTVYLRKK